MYIHTYLDVYINMYLWRQPSRPPAHLRALCLHALGRHTVCGPARPPPPSQTSGYEPLVSQEVTSPLRALGRHAMCGPARPPPPSQTFRHPRARNLLSLFRSLSLSDLGMHALHMETYSVLGRHAVCGPARQLPSSQISGYELDVRF